MFAFECLSESLGLLFEPYVIRIIPVLLKGLGEGAFQVRDAAQVRSSQQTTHTPTCLRAF